MTIGKVWSARLAAALALAAVVPACTAGGSGGQAVGVDNQVLWNSNASSGQQPTGTPDFWNAPGTGPAAPIPNDPEDTITYTAPIIFILGLRHPLSTVVTFQQAPNIVLNEERADTILIQYRVATYKTLLGNPTPLPPAATLQDYPQLTQCARAHCKHYPVWHPTLVFPLTNVEGDNVAGRLNKAQIVTTAVMDFILSGTNFQTGDEVANNWITTIGNFDTTTIPPTVGQLLNQVWTHLDVGFWQLGGTNGIYYWELILAEDPGPNVVLPQIPAFPIFP